MVEPRPSPLPKLACDPKGVRATPFRSPHPKVAPSPHRRQRQACTPPPRAALPPRACNSSLPREACAISVAPARAAKAPPPLDRRAGPLSVVTLLVAPTCHPVNPGAPTVSSHRAVGRPTTISVTPFVPPPSRGTRHPPLAPTGLACRLSPPPLPAPSSFPYTLPLPSPRPLPLPSTRPLPPLLRPSHVACSPPSPTVLLSL